MKYRYNLPKSADLAEVIGIMMGDGCIHLTKRGLYQTVISFNKKEISYLYYVKGLMRLIFDDNYVFYKNNLKNEYLLVNFSKTVGDELKANGLFHGNKIKNKLIIPSWILADKYYLRRFFRGIFDTDGSVYRKYCDYAQIQFKLACEETIQSLHEGIIILGFNPTKIQKEKNKDFVAWKFYLSRQKEIDIFFQNIFPRNQKNWDRYNKIRNGAAGI